MKLSNLDPATLMASAEVDAIIHDKWMGRRPETCPPYSNNADYAGKARRLAKFSDVAHTHGSRAITPGCAVAIECCGEMHARWCGYTEVHESEESAEALATARAIIAALQAWESGTNQPKDRPDDKPPQNQPE